MRVLKPIPLFLLSAVFAASVPCVSPAALLLRVTVDAIPADGRGEARTNAESQVVLADRFFSADGDGFRTIYDLATRRVVFIDLGRKTYQERSLYADLWFRIAELQNRIHLADVLAKSGARAGADDSFSAAVFQEHVLSMVFTDSTSSISFKEGKARVTCKAEGKELLSYSTKTVAADAGACRMFANFMHYSFGGHPVILKKLRDLGAIPMELTLSEYGGDVKKIVIRVESSEVVPDEPYSLEGLKPGLPAGDTSELGPFLFKVRYGSGNDRGEARAREILAAALADLKDGNYFEAMLGGREYSLQTDEPLPGEFRDSREALLNDRDCRQLEGALNPTSKTEIEQSIDTLAALQAKTERHKHVLQIFMADDLAWAGRPEDAIGKFLTALEANPYIAAAYKDLGDIYQKEFRMGEAWQCWDTGRWLRPQHSIFKDLNEYEQRIAADFPDFL